LKGLLVSSTSRSIIFWSWFLGDINAFSGSQGALEKCL
jgi:hypothetical protein